MFHKHPLIGKTIADDYKILSILGRGGMGTVFVAEQISMNRQVALKLMPTFDLSSEEAQRFEAEIAAMANICHPNIVAIHQRGKFDDSSSPTLYYSMELLEGGSLKQYLHDYGKLPPNVAIRHVKQIADALAYLHESGWIHRDIKPDNLLFNRNYRSLKIADFGIARLEKSVHITQSQSMVGTFLYSSPEQMKWYEKDRDPDYDIDGRTDQYSLGIVFYEMITGKLPFEATNLIEMVKTIDKPPIPISKYISNIPNSLEWLLNRMMEKKRDNRFATDDELLEAIANVEIEMATTNSSRIYAVKADDDSKPATNRNLLFDEEKLRISNMPTIHTDIQALTKKTYMRMFIVFSVVFVTVFLISILFFKSKNKPVQQPKPPVTVPKINNNAQIQVNINIVPTFDPDLSSKNPSHYQLLFISQTDNQTYQSPKTLRPDTYKIVIILEGYTSPQNSKYVHIPAQKAYMIPIHFTAIARKISSTIQNIGGSPEMPLYYKIGDTVIDSDNIQIKPGKYKLHATFSQYQEINQEIMIEPSTKPYQYQTYLRPWENMPLHFSIPTYDFEKSDNLEIHIDDQVVSKELIEYVVQDQMIHIKVKYPNDAKNLTVYWGCYTNHSPISQYYLLSTLPNIDGEKFYQHLQELASDKLRSAIKHFWSEYEEQRKQSPENFSKHLGGINQKFQIKIYEYLKAQTIQKDYQNMDTEFWKIRQLYNPQEDADRKDFQKNIQATQYYTPEEKIKHWRHWKDKNKNNIYQYQAQEILEYIKQVQSYQEQFLNVIKDCIYSISEQRTIQRQEANLKKEKYFHPNDIQQTHEMIRQKIKELKCGKSLEEKIF